MPAAFVPRVDVLPPPQQRLWSALGEIPARFVLYGGTALALRIGHRQSADFDFFATGGVDSGRLLRETPCLRGAEVLQRGPDTLTCLADRGGPVRVSFFGGLNLRRVADPDALAAPAVRVASLPDLAATKAEVVQTRAAAKDYLDLDALIRRAGVPLPDALGAAAAVFGPAFNPLPTVKALSFFGDGDLAALPDEVRRRLRDAASSVDLTSLPRFEALPGVAPEAP